MSKQGLFFSLFVGLSVLSLAQGKAGSAGYGPASQLKGMYAEPYERKKEIRLDGKKYRIYSNYVTLGAGKGYNNLWNDLMFTPAVDFNFHLQKTYFQAGSYLMGQSLGNNQQVNMHLAGGYHKESYKYFWAAYGGLSYDYGYYPFMLQDMNGKDSAKVSKTLSEIGLYVALQAFYKVKFDYGIGVTLYEDFNRKQNTVGIRLELFFSGAYRGKIMHSDEED